MSEVVGISPSILILACATVSGQVSHNLNALDNHYIFFVVLWGRNSGGVVAEAGLAQSHSPAVGSSAGPGRSADRVWPLRPVGSEFPASLFLKTEPSRPLVAQPQRSHSFTSVVSSGRSTLASRRNRAASYKEENTNCPPVPQTAHCAT